MKNIVSKIAKLCIVAPATLFIIYVGLFQNDAIANVEYIKNLFGNQGLLIFDLLLIAVFVPVSLKLMNIVTGNFGLERFKSIFAISVGMTTLGFSALQFINAIATSSAEGATVVVEIFQQIAHLSHTGHLEEYGLIGMLTSDASGPWNSSIFPLIILIVWMLRKKKVAIELKQLHIPMLIQFILYAQQFLFALDKQYTLFEILLMAITATFFVIGMFSFLVSMFKAAEKEEQDAIDVAKAYSKDDGEKKESSGLSRIYDNVAQAFFSLITFNPSNQKVQKKHQLVKRQKVGFGQISRSYVLSNALQLTAAMTVAMFALVSSMQFLATQIKMSDAEAALFGTAGLTSAPEALVAFKAGPYINSLLLVGSNIIDGWFSAIGQTFLLGYAEIVSNGQISFIPLHPAISYLTFLSWTQGIVVWLALYLYARDKKKNVYTNLFVILLLAFSIVYYFGGAWFSAQALGYGAQYALESMPYKAITSIISWFNAIHAQKITLTLNIMGLFAILFWWTGIVEKIKKAGSVSEFDKKYRENIEKLMQKYGIDENQHVVILLDKSTSMDKKINLYKNKWIDIVFETLSNLALVLDDDNHIHVYATKGKSVNSIPNLLTPKNKDNYIDTYVGRDTHTDIYYADSLNQIYQSYAGRQKGKNLPVLLICLTDGYGKDYKELSAALKNMKDKNIHTHFVLVYGNQIPESQKELDAIKKSVAKNNTFSYSLLPSFEFANQEKLQANILKEYAKFSKSV
jgi:uncharacterized protein (UPF0333 family)